MAKIDTSQWREFAIGDLFDVIKGTRLTKANMKPGEMRFIGSSAMNNGVTASISNAERIHPANTLTVCYNGSVGETFYQDEPFSASDDVNVLYPKFPMTKPIGLFLAPLIRSVGKKYAFVDKWKQESMKLDTIKLPIKSDGFPDWNYMDSFMQNVMKESKASLKNLRRAEGWKNFFDTSQWREFVIGDLFPRIVKPPVLHSRQVIADETGIPYVVRTKFGNGVKYRVEETAGMTPSPAGVISFGAENAAFFYRDEPFVSGRDIYYIDTRILSKAACHFLITCLQPVAKKYSYNNGLFPALLKREKVTLPSTENDVPDWDRMETFMRQITERAKETLQNFSIGSAVFSNITVQEEKTKRIPASLI